MGNKITKNELQNINGGYSLEYNESRNKWKLSGIMKRNGGSTTMLRNNTAKGHSYTNYFDTKEEAIAWADANLE